MDDSGPIAVRASILFFRDERVLLCRRTDEEDVWVLPGGTPAAGEGTAAAARPEVAEETGLRRSQAERWR
ncbi:MAG TPA: NUDIX domain-containing protein [Acidimicrobiales bacterium]|nr:NUDIX domain-containing protein [Acidimicrobiales bacterium]